MRLEEALSNLWELRESERRVVYTCPERQLVTVTRTDKICQHDFRVGLVLGDRPEFFPTHVRLLFNLYLQRTSDPENFPRVLRSFERVYDGEDPLVIASSEAEVRSRLQLDTLQLSLCYGQLLMVEQEFNYGPKGCKKGNVQPPREFLMRFIRWIASGEDEIDRIIAAAVRNYPPPTKFASKEAAGEEHLTNHTKSSSTGAGQ